MLWQWEESSSGRNPQSDISCEEHLKMLWRILFAITSLPPITISKIHIVKPLKATSTSPFTFNIVWYILPEHQYCNQHKTTRSLFSDTSTYFCQQRGQSRISGGALYLSPFSDLCYEAWRDLPMGLLLSEEYTSFRNPPDMSQDDCGY